MKLEVRDSSNYAAEVISMPAPFPLPNADRLEGFGIFGYTVISSKGNFKEGDLAVFFPAETQLSYEVARGLNLHRHSNLNVNHEKTGYLEDNRRVRALKLRGTISSGLVIPLAEFENLGFFGLNVGDKFDHIGGTEICRKYRIKEPQAQNPAKSKLAKAFKRVDAKLFPTHVETDQYLRNEAMLSDDDILIVTQKLHGTSGRFGRVPVRRELKWYERALKRLGVAIPEWEYDVLAGSRQVIKDIGSETQAHYYGTDLWNAYLTGIQDRIPKGFIVYGEIIGWTAQGAPIQKGHTYDERPGEHRLYVYRVSMINEDGELYDLSWDQVRRFCGEHGFQHVPELWRGLKAAFDVADFEEKNFSKEWVSRPHVAKYPDTPVPLSDGGTGKDEGIAIRVERGDRVPLLFKYKNASHYEFETKVLDSGEVDLESAEA